MELRWHNNVVLQQTEHDDMASDNRSDQRAAPSREPRKVIHSIPASPQGGPPNFSGGLELPRSSHC
jgi:hypothetical protein